MIGHGISSAGMFFCVGVIYDRVHHRNLNEFGGLYGRMPLYTALAIGIFFAGLGLPGLCGFIGEVLVVLSAWNFSGVLAVISAFVVILTAAYILWAIQRVYLGAEYKGPHGDEITPITLRETCVAAPLLILAIWFGVYPKVVFNYMDKTIDQQVTTLAEWTPTYVAQKEKEASDKLLPATAQANSGPRPVDLTARDLTARDLTARDLTAGPTASDVTLDLGRASTLVQRSVSVQRPASDPLGTSPEPQLPPLSN